MTGWRVGYLLADVSLVPNMAKIQEGIVSCVPAFLQIAAAEALTRTDCVEQMREEYACRDILIDGINAIPGFSCKKSTGSFYAFVNIKAFGKTSEEFAEELIRNVLKGLEVEIVEEIPVEYRCTCGKERVEEVLSTIDNKELEEIIRDGEDISVSCQFCDAVYRFTPEDVAEILSRKLAARSDG